MFCIESISEEANACLMTNFFKIPCVSIHVGVTYSSHFTYIGPVNETEGRLRPSPGKTMVHCDLPPLSPANHS